MRHGKSKPAHPAYVLSQNSIAMIFESNRSPHARDWEAIHASLYMEIEELATFLGHFYYALTIGSGRILILRDIYANPLETRNMKLEDAVSLYNRREYSHAYDELTPFAKQVVRTYPNRGVKLSLQRNSKSKYGVCSSLVGGISPKQK